MVQSLSRKLILLTLLFPFTLVAKLYIFSYQSHSTNYVNDFESYKLSQAMVPVKVIRQPHILTIENKNNEKIEELFEANRDEILEYIFKFGVDVENHTSTNRFISKDRIKLTFRSAYLDINQSDSTTTIQVVKRDY